jgi:hypothetical protein
LRPFLCALALALAAPFPAGAQPAPNPVVYNNLDGDGSQDLDKAIKQAYADRYTVRDTRHADGYAEPRPTAGSLPKVARDDKGQQMMGYVLVAYIVSAAGLVVDPVVLRTTDSRLSSVALEAMAKWRFSPGLLAGAAVATTAAQEFNFGVAGASGGFHMTRLVVYQDNPTLMRRLPPKDVADVYLDRLVEVAHNFSAADPTPETLHIIVMLRPGGRSRVWFLSSIRFGNDAALVPLRKLLEAVPALAVREGPVILCISGVIMGGDGNELPADLSPIPADWSVLESGLKEPLPIGSDTFMDMAWPDAAAPGPPGPLPLTAAPAP